MGIHFCISTFFTATFTGSAIIQYGSTSVGLWSSSDSSPDQTYALAMSAPAGDLNVHTFGSGVDRAVAVLLDPADSQTVLGTTPAAPEGVGERQAMISMMRFNDQGALVSGAMCQGRASIYSTHGPRAKAKESGPSIRTFRTAVAPLHPVLSASTLARAKGSIFWKIEKERGGGGIRAPPKKRGGGWEKRIQGPQGYFFIMRATQGVQRRFPDKYIPNGTVSCAPISLQSQWYCTAPCQLPNTHVALGAPEWHTWCRNEQNSNIHPDTFRK